MRFPDSTGLLLTIVDGFIKGEEMMVQPIDNYHYPFHDFIDKAQAGELISSDIEDCIKVPKLYIIAGYRDKVYRVEQTWRTKIKQAFEQFCQNEQILKRIKGEVKKREHYCLESFYWLYLSELMTGDHVYYPREMKIENEDLVILAFYWTPNLDDNLLDRVEQTISFWMDREQPALKGYQCLNRSFILQNMIGRKVLATVDLKSLYQSFCDYIGKHICPYTLIEEKILEVNQFIAVLKITLGNIKEYLKGEEEAGVSKNILMMMRNRHAYLPVVHKFIRRNSDLAIINTSCSITFDYRYWENELDNLRKATRSDEKGKRLEDLIQYFIGAIPGLKVTDVRAKRGRAEVDIFCCNISYDSCLWKLGALVLIECKNRKEKVEVSDIRNMVPTMEAKGIHGAMIYSRAGFSSVAMSEIKHQLLGGKIIVPVSLEELERVGKEKSAYDLMREKIDHFDKILEDDDRQLYF